LIRRNTRLSVATRSLCLALTLAFGEGGARAQSQQPDFVIRDIRVEGAQRTDVGTVFGYLPLRVGDHYDAGKGTAAIRALYASGLFKDVRLEADGDVLVVVVEERPAIASVEVVGMREFDKDQVKKSLKDVGLAEARIYDRSLLDRAEQELKRQYLTRGRYGVKVTTTVSPLERNRVAITISIDEGEVARIREIRFTGNQAFKDSQLRDQMELTTPGWLTWYTGHDKYARQKLQADEEKLRSYYLARGYLDFNIESTQVSISPDKKDIFITINLLEGERYRVSSVRLAGELLGLDAELSKLVTVKPGEIYNGEKINTIAKAVTDRLSVLGYAFANANPVPDSNKEKREVAFTILVDPGRRAYVRHVNISGNTRTRDEVIRREIRQFESGWFDSEKVKLSRDRIDRLGYFEKVEVETPAVPGSQDQVDVDVKVKERPTGTIQAGLGYSSTEHLVISGAYTQQDILGTGHAVGVQINTSSATRTIAISHTNPYVTLDGVSQSEEVYVRNSNLAKIGLSTVDIGTTGGTMRWGVPFTEFDTIFFGIGVENTNIDLTSTSPYVYVDYVNKFGSSPASLFTTVGWARDNRDNILTPSRGRFQRAFLEVGTPVLDLEYYKATYQIQQFAPLTNKLTLAANGQAGYGGGYGGKDFPLFKNFYVGGIGSVRGFYAGSLGPRDINNNPLGGVKEVNGSIELQSQLPGADRSLQALVFFDSGYVWAEGAAVNFGDLRAAAGVGIAWISPIGPLKLSLAQPVRYTSIDRVQRFQFQIGTGF
jgi:outer membrane protein insertion porin family